MGTYTVLISIHSCGCFRTCFKSRLLTAASLILKLPFLRLCYVQVFSPWPDFWGMLANIYRYILAMGRRVFYWPVEHDGISGDVFLNTFVRIFLHLCQLRSTNHRKFNIGCHSIYFMFHLVIPQFLPRGGGECYLSGVTLTSSLSSRCWKLELQLPLLTRHFPE